MDPRYTRQTILPGIGHEGQDKLARSRVLVIGMGGLGSPASIYLASAGIGTLGIADMDSVEIHNLHRQILHRTNAVGTSKLDSAEDQLTAINRDLVLQKHPMGIQLDNACEIFSQYDIIVDGTDNFPSRYLNNDAAYFAGKPLVYGSLYQFEGQVSLFHGGGRFALLPMPVSRTSRTRVYPQLCGSRGFRCPVWCYRFMAGHGSH